MAIKNRSDKSPLIDPFVHQSNPSYKPIDKSPSPLDKYIAQGLSDDTNGIKFQAALQELVNGETDSSQLLASLLGAGNAQFSDERWDMFYQYLLGMMQQANQRAFDIEQRDESRLYNNPMNELARLMGSGVSRDAALEILKGSAGGSGSLGVAGSGSFDAPSVSAPSGTMELQKQQSIAGMVFGSLAALSNLVQSGVSVAQGIEQVNQLKGQNYFSNKQIEAFDSVQQLTSALQTMQTNGEIEPSEIEKLSNANDLIKFLQKQSESNDNLKQLIKSPAYATALGTSYGRNYFNQYWKSLRDTRDEGTLLDSFIRNQQLQNTLLNANIDKVGAEMENLGKQNSLINQQIIESCNRVAVGDAQISVLNEQGKFIQVQSTQLIRQTDSQVSLMDTQAFGQDITNRQLSLNYEYNEAGFPMLKLARVHDLELQLARWQCLTTPESMQKQMRSWLLEPQNAYDVAYLQNLYLNAVGSFAQQNPALWNLCSGFKASGAFDMVKMMPMPVSKNPTNLLNLGPK